MKNILLLALALVSPIIFAAGSLWLASEGKDGWGWFMFAAIVTGGVELKSKD